MIDRPFPYTRFQVGQRVTYDGGDALPGVERQRGDSGSGVVIRVRDDPRHVGVPASRRGKVLIYWDNRRRRRSWVHDIHCKPGPERRSE